jgi:hypothetical protein
MRTLDQIIAKLPPEERARVAARTKELTADEVGLRNLLKARRLTQQRTAKVLHIDQGGISKIESRSDMLLSTLRTYLNGMGDSDSSKMRSWGWSRPRKYKMLRISVT